MKSLPPLLSRLLIADGHVCPEEHSLARLSAWGAAVLLCLLAQGCSPKAEGAVSGASSSGSGSANPVMIVREKRHDFPEKFAASMREVQERCFAGKSAVAAAQGWAYDPATERLTDAEIAALDTERTEEYFDGKKYAKFVSGNLYDASLISVERGGTCKPQPQPFKSVEIHDGACNVLSIEYDLAKRTGSKTQLKGDCGTPENLPLQSGEAVAVPGTSAQCKWTPPGNALQAPECTLLPAARHAGTGLALVAIRKMPEHLRQSVTPLPGMQALDMQSLTTTEQAVAISMGAPIAAEKFQAPADSAAFPLVE
ncbi:MAG: hypothetical protein JWR60_3757 [Polaromonas sp.]|nr:hypothetical protein [Polaromonas sp.]